MNKKNQIKAKQRITHLKVKHEREINKNSR